MKEKRKGRNMEEKTFLVKEKDLQLLFDIIAAGKYDIPFGQVNQAISNFNKSIAEFKKEDKEPKQVKK